MGLVELRNLTKAWKLALLSLLVAGCNSQRDLGIFTESLDIGAVTIPGEAVFDSDTDEYQISGSGENIWGTRDGLHFLFTETQGDLRLEASVSFLGEGGNPHRKGGWMIRESLEPDAAYADFMVHGDGLVSLQFRRTSGGSTEEVTAPQKAPAVVRLERTGEVFSLFVSEDGNTFNPTGAVRLDLPDSVLVGLALCSHNSDRLEKAVFSHVSMTTRPLLDGAERVLESSLEIVDVTSGRRETIFRARDHVEAPNWSRDGKSLVFNQGGHLYSLPLGEQTPKLIDTAFANHCNNDHGFSPAGDLLAISHSPEGKSLIYILPAAGGEPRLVTQLGPSYWHSWSPDGSTLAYCAERNGEYDIYTIPVAGGAETRLTDAPGLDDGPDYSPDGEFIYINSERTGLMKIWRISPDGKTQEQITFDSEYADWFPHPSPDGKWIVFLSYDSSVKGHPPNKEVALRLMSADGTEPGILTRFFGGQGTINVPSWSPDSKQVAFVSYRLVLP